MQFQAFGGDSVNSKFVKPQLPEKFAFQHVLKTPKENAEVNMLFAIKFAGDQQEQYKTLKIVADANKEKNVSEFAIR